MEIAKTLKAQLGDAWQLQFYQMIVDTFPDGISPDELSGVVEMLLPQDEPNDLLLRAVG